MYMKHNGIKYRLQAESKSVSVNHMTDYKLTELLFAGRCTDFEGLISFTEVLLRIKSALYDLRTPL